MNGMNARETSGAGREPDIGESAGEPTAVLPETAVQSEERAKNHWAQSLRAVADVENVRKRAQRDVEAAHRYGIDKLAQELLPVRDSLELAVENADKADAQQLSAGS